MSRSTYADQEQMTTDEQIERFIRLSQSLHSRLVRPGAEEWPDVELTMGQLRTLVLLAERPRRMSDIAASLGTSLSSTTSMIERLETRELVARMHDPDDRRVVVCRITSMGHDDLERFWRLRQSRIRALAGLLRHDEFEHVIGALQIVSDALARSDMLEPVAGTVLQSA